MQIYQYTNPMNTILPSPDLPTMKNIDTVHELDHASGVFHNCVRTYSEDVRDGKCYIVLMTDHTGLMQACLEVRDGGLVQARLKYNKPVSCDGAVNGAVRDWCREAGLYIRTPDVRQVRYPVPIERRAV